jgi:malonyl-CoA O-methyltransferase
MQNHPYNLPLSDIIHARQRAAKTYEQAAVLAHEVGKRLFERLEYIRLQPQVVLELGCATGILTRQLIQRYPQAQTVGIDLVLDLLKLTQKNTTHQADLLAATLDKLPLASQCVDLVVANLCLAWYLDINAVFQELKRVLKPGGLLMFTTLGPDTLKELRQSWAAVDDYPHVHAFYDMHDIGDALLHLQYADPVLDVERLTVTYASIEQFLQELKSSGAVNIAQGRRQTLMSMPTWQKFIAAYQRHQDGTGRIPASFEIIYGHAWLPVNTGEVASEDGNIYFSADQLVKRRKKSV